MGGIQALINLTQKMHEAVALAEACSFNLSKLGTLTLNTFASLSSSAKTMRVSKYKKHTLVVATAESDGNSHGPLRSSYHGPSPIGQEARL